MASIPRDLVREIIRLMGQDPTKVRRAVITLTPGSCEGEFEVMSFDRDGHPVMNQERTDLKVQIRKFHSPVEGQ